MQIVLGKGPATIFTVETATVSKNARLAFVYNSKTKDSGLQLWRRKKMVMDIFFGENEDNYLLWAIGRFALGAYTDSDVAKARRKPSVKGYLVMDEVTGHGNKVLILGFNPKQHRFAVILRHLNDVRIGTLDPEFTTKYVDLAFARFALGAYEFVDEFQEAVLLKESERAADFVKTPSSLQVKLPTQKDFD